jgi:hypothetical protein
MLVLRAALRGNQTDTDHFFSAIFQTTPPEEFFAPENIMRIMGAQPNT